MRAGHASYGNLLATRQRNERVFAFGYTDNSEPAKSGCERTNHPTRPQPHDAASRPVPNLTTVWSGLGSRNGG